MKRFFSLLNVTLAASFGLAACTTGGSPSPTVIPAPTATAAPAVASPTPEMPATPTTVALPTATIETPSAPTPSAMPGTAVSFDRLSLVLPTGVATNGGGTLVAKAEGDAVAPWDVAPAHVQFKLEGYALQGKVHQPQIYVYPAEAYAQVQQRGTAAQSLERLRAVLARNAGEPVTAQELPAVPFFNEAQAFAANVKVVAFQNGRGVRMLTQYAQGPVPVNNHELIYHVEGLTSDGQYYVIAILPVTAPGLPEDAQPGTPVPAGGVAMPDLTGTNPDLPGYYTQVQHMLEGLPPEAFAPNLDQLDALIGSITIAATN